MRLGMLCFALVLSLGAACNSYAANESCASGSNQCSKEIAATSTNSAVFFGFNTTEVCVTNKTGSTDIAYVNFGGEPATADADISHPIAVGETVCLGDQKSINEVNLICAATDTATVQVLALKVR